MCSFSFLTWGQAFEKLSPTKGTVKFGGADDFNLLLGTKQRDLMQTATHDTAYISSRYKSGPYLIFDCERGNYACVHKDGYQFCKDLRIDSLHKKYKVLSCAPLKKFSHYQFCIKRQKELVDFPVKKYFCMNSMMIEELLNFQR